MVDILYHSPDHDEQGIQLVAQLGADYHPGWEDHQITLVTATLESNMATLARISDGKKPKRFSLSSKEADAFVEAWTAYRAELQAAKAAEQLRLQGLHDEAYAIAKAHPEIVIEEKPGYGAHGNMAWDVSIPSLGFTYYNYAYGPETLKER